MEIYINPPKEIPLTTKEFHSMSIYGFGCFFINWNACIERLDNGNLKVWTNRYSLALRCSKNYRFVKSIWYNNESLEVYHCTVTEDYLKDMILKYFGHLFLKEELEVD